MRRIIQRTVTTINITSFIYVEETGESTEQPIDSSAGQQLLSPIEQPSDDGQPSIQT